MLDGLAPAMALSMDPQALGNPIDSGVPYYAAQEEQAAKQALTLVGWNDDIPAAAFADGQGRIPAGSGRMGWPAAFGPTARNFSGSPITAREFRISLPLFLSRPATTTTISMTVWGRPPCCGQPALFLWRASSPPRARSVSMRSVFTPPIME